MTNKVIIFGNLELAQLNYFYLVNDSTYKVVAFTTDETHINSDNFIGLPVVPFEHIETIYPPGEYRMSILLGFRQVNRLRAQKYHQAKAKGYSLISYVSSKAIVWPEVKIGDNCYIHEGAIVQPFVTLGSDVVIAPGAIVGHHTRIEDHCFVAAGAIILGCVTIEAYCVLGANATVVDGVTIARECILGSGSLITKTTREKGVYVGRPAELMPKPSDQSGPLLTWSRDLARGNLSETTSGQQKKES
jgi:sugar O-acyltransferase (sialic acid O-acetyltransferase NeuD family)